MSVLENFKNIPRSPYWGAIGLKCIFFLQICNEVPGEKIKGPCRPPTGDRPLSPTPQATNQAGQPTGARGAGRPSCGRQGGCRPPIGRQAPVARWGGDRPPLFFPGTFIFLGTYFELFERVFVIIVGKISAANSYRT